MSYLQAYKNKMNEDEPQLPALPYTPKQLYFIAFAQVWCEPLLINSRLLKLRIFAKWSSLAKQPNTHHFHAFFKNVLQVLHPFFVTTPQDI